MQDSASLAENDVDEAALIARLQRRDASAFELLVRHYGPRMLAVARRFVRNDEDAQDVLQEAFLSAFRSIEQFAAASRLNTWLHRIVVNAALMRLRTQRRRPETSIDELLPQFLEDGHQVRSPVNWPDTADRLIERRETAELVRGLIDRLPDGYREVLLLRDIDGWDTDETSQLLDLTPGTVKVRLHRARQALRTLLDPYMQGELG